MSDNEEYKKICQKERDEKAKKFFIRVADSILGLWVFSTCLFGTASLLGRIFGTTDVIGMSILLTCVGFGAFLMSMKRNKDSF